MLWILTFLPVGLSHRITRSTPNLGPKFHGSESKPTTEALRVSHLAASPYSYPFMGLVTDYKKQCGGCLVSHNVVVTAAHCLGSDARYVLLNFNVILHRYQLNIPLESDGASKFNVTETFLHPKYDTSLDAAAPHDVAVLVINNKQRVFDGVDLDLTVRIDRGKYSAVNEGARLLGWGTTSDELISANKTYTSAKPTVVMKEMNLVIRRAEDCTYREFEKGYSLCAQGLTTEEIPCKGDSGGPLIHLPQGSGDTRYTFVGIVSFGSTNCTLNTVFARVASYSNFIIDKVRRYSPRSPVASTTPNTNSIPGMVSRKPQTATLLKPATTTPKPPAVRANSKQGLEAASPAVHKPPFPTVHKSPSPTVHKPPSHAPSKTRPAVHTLAVTTAIGQEPITVSYITPAKETDLGYVDKRMTEILLNLQPKEPLPRNYRAYALNRAFPTLDEIAVEYFRPRPTTSVQPIRIRAPRSLRLNASP